MSAQVVSTVRDMPDVSAAAVLSVRVFGVRVWVSGVSAGSAEQPEVRAKAVRARAKQNDLPPPYNIS